MLDRWSRYALLVVPQLLGCSLGLPDAPEPPDRATAHDAGSQPLMASPLFVDELLGAYDSDWGPLTLSRAEGGTGLVGYYGRPSDPSRMGQGRLAGSVVGHRFIYVWAGDESGDQGRGYFERDEAGSGLTGRWGYGQSDADGGTWHARRL